MRAPDAACSSSIMLTPMRSIRSPRLLVAFLVVGFFAEMHATFAIRRKAFVVGVAVMRRDGCKRVAIGGAPRCLPIPGGRVILRSFSPSATFATPQTMARLLRLTQAPAKLEHESIREVVLLVTN